MLILKKLFNKKINLVDDQSEGKKRMRKAKKVFDLGERILGLEMKEASNDLGWNSENGKSNERDTIF